MFNSLNFARNTHLEIAHLQHAIIVACTQMLQDLIPILLGCGDNPILRNDIIRLLVNLTQPAFLCFGGGYPKGKDADMMKCFMEVNKLVIMSLPPRSLEGWLHRLHSYHDSFHH